MELGRRTVTLLVALAVVGGPAALLRALCVGHSCDEPESTASEIPFCSLPSELKERVEAGFREGRSPDVLAVARRPSVVGSTELAPADLQPPWTSVEGGELARVPIVFSGTGVDSEAVVPAGTALDDIAPTVARIMELERAHPEVRSGRAVDDVAGGGPPRLVLEVVLRGIGSLDLEGESGQWPYLESLMKDGVATMDGDVGSLPLDPAAALTTLGTGGLPSQHGITGTYVRNHSGKLVRAFGRGAPVTVIAALGDDLDEVLDQRPRIGMVASQPSDRGAIGGDWYVDVDTDDFVVAPEEPARAVTRMLDGGYGTDDVVDLVAVTLEGSLPDMDAALESMVEAAGRASGGSVVVVVTATGSLGEKVAGEVTAAEVAAEVEEDVAGTGEVVEAAVPGGIYLDQKALESLGVTEDDVLSALRAATGSQGSRLFNDTFTAIAVSFARYC